MSTRSLSADPVRRGEWPGARSLRAVANQAADDIRWPAWPVALLIISLVVPWQISIGPIALTMYRIALVILAIPCLARWASGKAGRIRVPDVLIALYCIWCLIALIVVHRMDAIESGGILFLETFIAYLVARCYVRSAADLRAVAKLLFLVVAFTLPFALVETVTGYKAMIEFFAKILPALPPTGNGLRLGLTRVQGPFEHPILFGVFCGGILAITHGVLGRDVPLAKRWLMSGIVIVTAALSWSSGPLLSVAVQIALLGWNFMFRSIGARWRILWALAVISYAVLEVASEQSVPLLLTRFAFDPWTAYYRLLIWDNGWNSIFLHPLFGTGFGEWTRPAWMPPSIDMFWIVPAIRHGLPAFCLFMAASIWIIVTVGLSGKRSAKIADYRAAYLISIAAFVLAGCTVHFWNATYVLFMFLLGSGIWILDAGKDTDAVNESTGRRSPLARSRASRPLAYDRSERLPTSSCANGWQRN